MITGEVWTWTRHSGLKLPLLAADENIWKKKKWTRTFRSHLQEVTNDRSVYRVSSFLVCFLRLSFSLDLDPALGGTRAAQQLQFQGVVVQAFKILGALLCAALGGPVLHQRVRVQREAVPAGAEQRGR